MNPWLVLVIRILTNAATTEAVAAINVPSWSDQVVFFRNVAAFVRTRPHGWRWASATVENLTIAWPRGLFYRTAMKAALDAALEAGVPCGGWCPDGRLDENGVIPPHYPLRELPGGDFTAHTLKNVQDSDGW